MKFAIESNGKFLTNYRPTLRRWGALKKAILFDTVKEASTFKKDRVFATEVKIKKVNLP